MQFIDKIITRILKIRPILLTFYITILASIFAFIATMSIVEFVNGNYGVVNEFSYKLFIFNSIVIPLLITPILSYKLIQLGHNRSILIDKLEYLSKYDDLTAIKNRRYTLELGKMEYDLSKRYNINFSVILIDFDYFKEINDNYGHQVGDASLIKISNIISNTVRKSDIFGRYGGDEFILFCPYTDIDFAYAVANKIKDSLNKNLKILDFSIKMSASLGCATLNLNNNESIKDLIHKADNALYKAKKLGRNRVEISK